MNLREKIELIKDAKDDMREALISKGSTPSGDITTYADAIMNINSPGRATTATITPTTTSQTLYPTGNYTRFDKVIVDPVTASIDPNITANNIVRGIKILGITGEFDPLNGQTKIITLNGTYTPESPFNAFSSVNVNVQGIGIKREVSNEGVYQLPSSDFTFRLPEGATDIGDGALCPFSGCETLIGVNMSSLIHASGQSAVASVFNECPNLISVDLSSLESVSGLYAFSDAFTSCTGLTSVDLSSLESVSGHGAFYQAFQFCSSLNLLDLRSLRSVSGSEDSFYRAFTGCTSLTSVDLSSLEILSGDTAFNETFSECTNLALVDLSSLNTISGDSAMYGTFEHGEPIVGNALIVDEGLVDGEPDIIGFSLEYATQIKERLEKIKTSSVKFKELIDGEI